MYKIIVQIGEILLFQLEMHGDGSGITRTTGYSEYWKANNIYDLSGNVWEYTQERYDEEYYVCRGGIVDDYDHVFTVIARYYLLSSVATDRGFRVSFYI